MLGYGALSDKKNGGQETSSGQAGYGTDNYNGQV